MRTRICFTLVGSVVVLASVAIIVCVWKWDYRFGLPVNTDKITRINTVVAASAYIAAIVAAVFALIAYWQASGLPSLAPEISFLPFNSGSPAFTATAPEQAMGPDQTSRRPGSTPCPLTLLAQR
jgi:hypothetical protein